MCVCVCVCVCVNMCLLLCTNADTQTQTQPHYTSLFPCPDYTIDILVPQVSDT